MIALPFAHHPVAEALLLFAPMLALAVALALFVVRERRRHGSTRDRKQNGGAR